MKIQITAANFDLGLELEKYARHKLEGLTRHVPHRLREVSALELTFYQHVSGKLKQNTCELCLRVPRDELTARETTQHMYAALDIAVANVEQQLRDYKNRPQNQHWSRRLTRRWHTK